MVVPGIGSLWMRVVGTGWTGWAEEGLSCTDSQIFAPYLARHPAQWNSRCTDSRTSAPYLARHPAR